jgi:aryl-alcohol dehydrogenase-like predicted oxidoreductase
MEQRSLGGLSVSVIGVGCNNFGQRFGKEQTTEVVLAALDSGVNYFDTSDSYGQGSSEECLGFALKNHRTHAIIATKYDGAPGDARSSCLASLARLQMDYIDLYQIHHPYLGAPVAETIGALSDLVDEGLVREIGCSNFSVPQLREARAMAEAGHVRFVSVQNDYNLLNRKQELDVIPECQMTSVAFNAYFPLYHGLLTGKFHRGAPLPGGTRLGAASTARKAAVFTTENFDVVEQLTNFAMQHGKTLLDVALARLIYVPGVTSVIAGATWPDQVRANAASAQWVLSEELCREIDVIAPCRGDAKDTPSAAHGIA